MDVSEPGHERGRILVVDDDSDFGEYLSRVLRSRGGFYVTHELGSAGALHRIETEEWDLLITDIELPGRPPRSPHQSSSFPSRAAKAAACVRRCMPSLVSSADT